jgi:hypothetical protein
MPSNGFARIDSSTSIATWLRNSIVVGPHHRLAQAHDRELEREAAGLEHAGLHVLGELAEVRVARRHLRPGVADADHRLADEQIVREPLVLHPRAVDEIVAPAAVEPRFGAELVFLVRFLGHRLSREGDTYDAIRRPVAWSNKVGGAGMHAQADAVARIHREAPMRHEDELRARDVDDELGLGAGRLDDDDLAGNGVRRPRRGELEVLGTHAEVNALPVAAGRAADRPADAAVDFDVRAAVRAPERALDHVHRRRADELRDEQVVRAVVELERRADLLDDAVVHHDDAVGHRHRLDLVVRDVDGRRLEALVQRLDLAAHRDAQLRVQVRQWLVEQEHLGIAHDRAAHRDALALAAR